MAFNFGNGLIEIAALTTLVGATTAESLILGSRGVAGLPWAAMSTFGSFYIIKTCIAASMPGWLRETLGVNSPLCCSILGVSSKLDNKTMLKVAPGNPAGIRVKNGRIRGKDNKPIKPSVECVYTFDEYTNGIVRSCPSFQHGETPRIFAHVQDGRHGYTTMGGWLAIAATIPKLVETAVLWRYASWKLSVASTANWAFFFVAAVLLQALGISREFRDFSSDSRTCDILAGDIPTVHGPGKELRIILGVPINVRRHLAWLFTWGIGSLICLSSTVATYMILGKQNPEHFYIWALFQGLWLIARSVFFHFAVITDGRPSHPVVEKKVTSERYRLLSMASGVSRHLAQVHPRTSESYLGDLQDPWEIQSYIRTIRCELNWQKFGDDRPFDDTRLASSCIGDFIDIDVLAVIGDTMLSSFAWIYGSDMSGMDLYDACLIVLKIDKQTLLVPACRVLSGNVRQAQNPPADTENGNSPLFIPMLGPCRGPDNGWAYWIPIGSDRWLYLVCGLDSLVLQRAEVLHSEEVTRRLMLGTLWVSLTNVEDVKVQVERSAIVGRMLMHSVLMEEQDAEDPGYNPSLKKFY